MFFLALGSIQSHSRTVYFGTGTSWIEGQLGHVLGITAINAS